MNNIHFRYGIIFFAAILLQATMVKFLEIASWKPDLVLITLVMYAINSGPNYGSTAGFFTGLLSDVVSGGTLGLGALSKSISGYLAAKVSLFFQEKSRFILTLFICGFVHDFIYIFINTLGKDINWRVIVFVHIIPNLLYTAIIGIGIHISFGKWLVEHEQY